MPDYFCTVGFGLEHFAARELELLSNLVVQETLIGKVFFTKATDPAPLLSLKTIERLFVKVIHSKVDADIDDVDNWLDVQLTAETVKWSDYLEAWRKAADCQVVGQLKFRVNSKLSGRFRKLCNYQKVSALVSSYLIDNLNLLVDLHQPNLEVILHLNDNCLSVGLQVSAKPLSQRCYLRHIAVRSTVCCALCFAAQVSCHDVLLDPMCGAATILVEAVKQFGVKLAVGVDSDSAQLGLASENLAFSSTSDNVHLILADSCSPMIREHSVDVIICDVPFGRKFGSPDKVKSLLKRIVLSMDFVLRPGGRIAILISEQLQQYLIDITCHWKLQTQHQHPLRLGTLPAAILVWRK